MVPSSNGKPHTQSKDGHGEKLAKRRKYYAAWVLFLFYSSAASACLPLILEMLRESEKRLLKGHVGEGQSQGCFLVYLPSYETSWTWNTPWKRPPKGTASPGPSSIPRRKPEGSQRKLMGVQACHPHFIQAYGTDKNLLQTQKEMGEGQRARWYPFRGDATGNVLVVTCFICCPPAHSRPFQPSILRFPYYRSCILCSLSGLGLKLFLHGLGL